MILGIKTFLPLCSSERSSICYDTPYHFPPLPSLIPSFYLPFLWTYHVPHDTQVRSPFHLFFISFPSLFPVTVAPGPLVLPINPILVYMHVFPIPLLFIRLGPPFFALYGYF